MFLKRILSISLFFSLAVAYFISCTADDICEENTTPKCIIVFRDASNPSAKKQADSLYIRRVSALSDTIIFKGKDIDSVAISLEISPSITTTQLFLYKTYLATQDKITLTYTPEAQYISPACGFRRIFTNLNTVLGPQNFIQSIQQNATAIENEATTHLFIYH